ncbi:SRPBCC family protein [Polyangium aurulentum]|uniref:SRPBCC family protein n=1 Tax=Polyangium aurulentum TaxID=2567896 RepID=UPI00146EC9F6|nr:SRPBCC domain-containing protein [Polyangium aurulentum]UQA60573.1 SRPBCC domain-containing protein [Polyangium aurulentum]
MTSERENELPEAVTKSIEIDASPADVWRALTDPPSMRAWISDDDIEVTTNWEIGSPILFRGDLHGEIGFENRGTVRAFEPERTLRYSHWSTLSRSAIPDTPENHVVIEFALTPSGSSTRLDLTLSNLVDYVVYKHLDFYWGTTLVLLKRFCEHARSGGQGPASAGA